MHPNPAFRTASASENLAFARTRGFGLLTVAGQPWPLAAHVPFVFADEGDGMAIDFHLVRSNPVVRAMPAPALMAISGPDAYVSPDWYQMDDQVPTWNYVAIHLRGQVGLLPQDRLRAHVDQLSTLFEARLLPKPIWRTDKLPRDVLDRFMRMIVPCRLVIEDVQGTWKYGQNKPPAARLSAARHMPGALAQLMGQEEI